MAREGNKWRVVKGDSLWKISNSVYGNGNKWPEIADLNGINKKNPIIYPGRLLKLPGITPGTSGGGSKKTAPTKPSNVVTIKWWALDAGETSKLFCVWSHTKDHTEGYKIEVWYNTGQGGWRLQGESTTKYSVKQYTVSADSSAKKVKLKIKPYSSKHTVNNKEVDWWTNGKWVEVTYDFANNPPLTPSTPAVSLDTLTSKLTCSLENIDPKINADQIEFVIYKNNTTKYKSGLANINKADDGVSLRNVNFVCELEPGGSYIVRCRAVRNNTIYGNWSDYTAPVKTVPTAPSEITEIRPQVFNEQGNKEYGVYLEWSPVETAKQYEIEYTTNPEFFDVTSSDVESVTTDEDQGNKILIMGIELGHAYFFRVRALNESGNSGWTGIKSVTLGTKPEAPTTWSNTQNCIIGEILKIYWTHNSTDGSLESIARIHLTIEYPESTSKPTLELDKVIRNTKPEEDKSKTSMFEIDPTDIEYGMEEGCLLKYKIQTAGVVEEYSDWSIEREVNVYTPPELEIDIKNQNGQSIDMISNFPFYISVTSAPKSQIPISYYIEIVANSGYETVDNVGKKLIINPGDKVYQKYFDPSEQAWEFMLEMSPGNINLQNGIDYTVNATVSMNSGLTGTKSMNFSIQWSEDFYTIDADIILNRETLEASIHPYCYEYYEDETIGETLSRLTDNCLLSVYRKEYDGRFTLIASGINNTENTYVIDPHPSLDYARYRIVSTTKDTGSISYNDIEPVKFGEPSLVIQWAEEWSDFEINDEENEEPPYSGSMIKIPYNVDINESASIEVSLINYIGRTNPVSYYGTHTGESFTGNCEIPREDTNMIYELRRLAKWAGDVYVREPSGIGYWANVGVSFNLKHRSVTIPVTFNFKRVEGGI